MSKTVPERIAEFEEKQRLQTKRIDAFQYSVEKAEDELVLRREEIVIYEENIVELKKAPICSLKAYQETKYLLSTARSALTEAKSKLEATKSGLAAEQKQLEETERHLVFLRGIKEPVAQIIEFRRP